MSEQKHRKTIFICRIIAVCSALIFFILITIIKNRAVFDGIAEYLFFGAFFISFAGTFLSPFVIIGFKLKMQHQKSKDKTEIL